MLFVCENNLYVRVSRRIGEVTAAKLSERPDQAGSRATGCRRYQSSTATTPTAVYRRGCRGGLSARPAPAVGRRCIECMTYRHQRPLARRPGRVPRPGGRAGGVAGARPARSSTDEAVLRSSAGILARRRGRADHCRRTGCRRVAEASEQRQPLRPARRRHRHSQATDVYRLTGGFAWQETDLPRCGGLRGLAGGDDGGIPT